MGHTDVGMTLMWRVLGLLGIERESRANLKLISFPRENCVVERVLCLLASLLKQ